MTTIADVIERVYRDYLLPPGDQPTRFTVGSGGITDSATTLPVSTTLLDPEEQDLIGAGTLIEVGSELMLIEAVTGTPATSLTVRRGMFDTEKAAHVETDFVYLAPDFPRSVLFTAVADAVDALWPDLWAVAVEEAYASDGPIELPATVKEITDLRYLAGNRWLPGGSWDLLLDFPLTATGVAVQVAGLTAGTPIHLKYKKAPTRPTAEDDVLATLGVSESWVKVVAVGAVAQVIANEDIDRATIAYITQALESEGFQAGAGADLRNSLLQYQTFLMGPLKRGLDLANPTRVVVDRNYG